MFRKYAFLAGLKMWLGGVFDYKRREHRDDSRSNECGPKDGTELEKQLPWPGYWKKPASVLMTAEYMRKARTGPQRAPASEDTDRSRAERSEALDGLQKLLTAQDGAPARGPGRGVNRGQDRRPGKIARPCSSQLGKGPDVVAIDQFEPTDRSRRCG
ncbi:hypothetical protein GCM10009841_08200 [Microlunatus panaciterrae]